MKLIIGLGNPGTEYKETRHNIGFRIIDAFAKKSNFPAWQKSPKFKAYFTKMALGKHAVILAKPNTFMNESGLAVRAVQQYYKISTPDIWVMYDDIDLPLGSLRIRKQGSGGTHNGMKSILSCLLSEQFPRFRVGIKPDHMVRDLSRYVLGKFTKKESPLVNQVLKQALDALNCALDINIETAMNRYN